MNTRLSEAARFEYDYMYNFEHWTAAKKSSGVKRALREKMRKFVLRWDIEELYDRSAALQWNVCKGPYRLPRFEHVRG